MALLDINDLNYLKNEKAIEKSPIHFKYGKKTKHVLKIIMGHLQKFCFFNVPSILVALTVSLSWQLS